MARLFGYFANQSDRIRCALSYEGDAVSANAAQRADGWGVGSYQTGEVLLRRKPSERRESIHVSELVQGLRTDCALVHLRSATIGARSLENTHPFRYRQWLFAHTGSIPGFAALRPAVLEQVPDFLARSVRGETDSEAFFHLVLGQIHRTGRLDDPELDRASITTAIRDAVVALDALSAGAGQPRATLNCLLTNSHVLLALRRGLPMTWVRRQGIRDCAVCRRQPDVSGREPRRIDHETLKYVLITSDHSETAPGWYDVPEEANGAVLGIDRNLDAHVSVL
jgi:glutamine amidotransferase